MSPETSLPVNHLRRSHLPLCSIISINFNDRAGLLRTLQSAAKQSFKDFEHIVIDGGSTDESLAVIQDPLLCVDRWISEPHSGVYSAINKGLETAWRPRAVSECGRSPLRPRSGEYFRYSQLNGSALCHFDLEFREA